MTLLSLYSTANIAAIWGVIFTTHFLFCMAFYRLGEEWLWCSCDLDLTVRRLGNIFGYYINQV